MAVEGCGGGAVAAGDGEKDSPGDLSVRGEVSFHCRAGAGRISGGCCGLGYRDSPDSRSDVGYIRLQVYM